MNSSHRVFSVCGNCGYLFYIAFSLALCIHEIFELVMETPHSHTNYPIKPSETIWVEYYFFGNWSISMLYYYIFCFRVIKRTPQYSSLSVEEVWIWFHTHSTYQHPSQTRLTNITRVLSSPSSFSCHVHFYTCVADGAWWRLDPPRDNTV